MLSAGPHGIPSGSSPPVGLLPKPFPPFQHPGHHLLEENGFKQQKLGTNHLVFISLALYLLLYKREIVHLSRLECFIR
ncbi:hypothetical protein GIB67_008825 [Kingdonia uniflora]|uniref:Uncharacterized protein n=1 Tax=Kingdonia uniflora TaxID=39325 RepID=A0A7J7LVD1_9MAGN|nr:hypothetical protein GIB67_008825 [Kingdonia uniflora]